MKEAAQISAVIHRLLIHLKWISAFGITLLSGIPLPSGDLSTYNLFKCSLTVIVLVCAVCFKFRSKQLYLILTWFVACKMLSLASFPYPFANKANNLCASFLVNSSCAGIFKQYSVFFQRDNCTFSILYSFVFPCYLHANILLSVYLLIQIFAITFVWHYIKTFLEIEIYSSTDGSTFQLIVQ